MARRNPIAMAAGLAAVAAAMAHRDYVRQDALAKVEDRLAHRIGELDHQVRSVPMAVVGLLREAPPVSSRRRTTQ